MREENRRFIPGTLAKVIIESEFCCMHSFGMTTTLEEIHRDPAILDRAILRNEQLDILVAGKVTATLLPKAAVSLDAAQRVMHERFAASDWEFTVGVPMTRDERNTRG